MGIKFYKIVISIVFLLSLIPIPFAEAKLVIGDYAFEFDEKVETDTNADGKNDRTSYYLNGFLILAEYDEDKNGKPDLWLRYKNGDVVDLELVDVDGNGKPDIITEVSPQEKSEIIFDSKKADKKNALGAWTIILTIVTVVMVTRFFITKKYLKAVPRLRVVLALIGNKIQKLIKKRSE